MLKISQFFWKIINFSSWYDVILHFLSLETLLTNICWELSKKIEFHWLSQSQEKKRLVTAWVLLQLHQKWLTVQSRISFSKWFQLKDFLNYKLSSFNHSRLIKNKPCSICGCSLQDCKNNNNNQTYNRLRHCHLSESCSLRVPLKHFEHHSTIVLRGWRWSLIVPHYAERDASFSDSP